MSALSLSYNSYRPKYGELAGKCPVIILHGYFWNKEPYADLAQQLATATGRLVYVVDLRNHGKSPSSKEGTCYDMSLDLPLFFKERNITGASFVCHSIASTIAHLFALKNPERVEKIVMIDHPPYQYPTVERVRRYVTRQYQAQNKYLESLREEQTLDDARKEVLVRSAASPAQGMYLKKIAGDLTKVEGKFQWNFDFDFLYDIFQKDDGLFPVQPESVYQGEILIIRGNSPWVTDSKFFETLKYNPKAKLVSFPNNSHLLMFERADDFVAEVTEFFKTSTIGNNL